MASLPPYLPRSISISHAIPHEGVSTALPSCGQKSEQVGYEYRSLAGVHGNSDAMHADPHPGESGALGWARSTYNVLFKKFFKTDVDGLAVNGPTSYASESTKSQLLAMDSFKESSVDGPKMRMRSLNGLVVGLLHFFLHSQKLLVALAFLNQFGVASASVLDMLELGLASWKNSYVLASFLPPAAAFVHKESMKKPAQDWFLGILFGFLGVLCLFMRSDVQGGEELQSLSIIFFFVGFLILLFALKKTFKVFICPHCSSSSCDGYCRGGGAGGGNDNQV